MSDSVIRVENLGKKYLIGHQQQRGTVTLRDEIANATKSWFGLLNNPASTFQSQTEEFWALKDVSFEVKQGEVVGIIGRNGAGKSTLLKILSRITEPTTGKVCIKGRVASLLEVGTGFHPELTGRENVFLNGAVLGMSKQEITRKFDEIVEFSEVEKFIDTPVKYYSSGMYVRLAFAVSTYLEPEILFVDEVLAVGDLNFQKKCLDKIDLDRREKGVTSLFVSHNISTIRTICSQGIFLDLGQVKFAGDVESACNSYLRSLNKNYNSLTSQTRLYKTEEATIYDCWLEVNGERSSELIAPSQILVCIQVDIHIACLISFAGILKDQNKQPFLLAQYGLCKQSPVKMNIGKYMMNIIFPEIELASGKYFLDITIGEPNRKFYDYIEDALTFEVISPTDLLTNWTFSQSNKQGSILLDCEMQIV